MKRLLVGLVTSCLVAGLFGSAPAEGAAAGDRQQQVDAELRRLREEMGEAAAEEAELLADLKVTRKLRAESNARLAAADAAMAAGQQQLDALRAQFDAAAATESMAKAALEAARDELDDATDVLKDQAIGAFIHQGRKPTVGAAMRNLSTPDELPRVVVLVDAVAERQGQVIDRQRELEEATRQLEAAAAAAKLESAAERDRVAEQVKVLAAARSLHAVAAAETAAEAAREEALLARAKASKAASQKRIRELQQESSSIAALLRRSQAGQTTTLSGKGILAAPVAPAAVTSAFGPRVHPIFGDQRPHTGIDFRGSTGTPVLSSAEGVVLSAGPRSGYGNTVIIDHGGGLATLYAHLSRIAVSSGSKVSRGTTVGSVGATGYATGPHLHFEVRQRGNPVNPLSFL